MEILTPGELSANTSVRVTIPARERGKLPAPLKNATPVSCCSPARPSYSDVTISFSVLLGRSAADAFTSSG
jgi:hypothetical protein